MAISEMIFVRGKGRPMAKYRDTLRSSVQKRVNRSKVKIVACIFVANNDMYLCDKMIFHAQCVWICGQIQ